MQARPKPPVAITVACEAKRCREPSSMHMARQKKSINPLSISLEPFISDD